MNDCRVLTHHSAVTAQPRAGWHPGASWKPNLPKWRVVGDGSSKPSLLFWLTAQALPQSLSAPPHQHVLRGTFQCPRSEHLTALPQTHSTGCPHRLVFTSTGASSLHSRRQGTEHHSPPLPPTPTLAFQNVFFLLPCCDRRAVQQHLMQASNNKVRTLTPAAAL